MWQPGDRQISHLSCAASASVDTASVFIRMIRPRIPGQAPTHRIKNNQSYFTDLTFWLLSLLRQLMKYLLINLMFSNCLSGLCSWREKIIKINCQNSQSQTVNPIMNFSLTPVSVASAFPFFPLLLLFSWFLSLPQTVSFFPPVMSMNSRERRYFRFTNAYIFLKGFSLLCFDVWWYFFAIE